ncbi:hypothetical protein INT44_001309 [Umbelopsis vinacea]|uniref:Alginate lyase domain-containing protein n=1 Tax=Umbelopsis vinacea TaxID=44442 RepID=A0A8H7UME5_9FUNG|nr:hypothetical protein INT44_001309 [Umbelopsis vinacea]
MRRSVLAVLALMVVATTSQTIDDLASVEDYYESLDLVSSFSDGSDNSTVSIGTPGVGYHTAYTKIGGVQTDKINVDKLEITRTEYQLGILSDDLFESIISLKKRVELIMLQNNTYTVTSTTTKPPNNNTHYYYSLAPYSWPNCSGISRVVNKWTQCPWNSVDGKINPAGKSLSAGHSLTYLIRDGVDLATSYYLFGNSAHEQKFTENIRAFFIDPDTYMAPNMNYSQVVPDGPEDDWIGSRMGVLDTHGLITLLSAAELMAQSGGTYWTDSDTTGLRKWVREYRTWMETSRLGIAEGNGKNNHGTFYYAQIAAFSHYLGETNATRAAVNKYLDTIYDGQIIASGAQPLELSRAFSLHYSYYNLEALGALAKYAQSVGLNVFNTTNSHKASYRTAVNFLVKNTLSTKNSENPANFLPMLETSANVYGDDKTYNYTKAIKYIRNVTSGGDLGAVWLLWTRQ